MSAPHDDPTAPMSADDRAAKALSIANQYAGIDGGHHKMWVIDQMIRALTGCPVVKVAAIDCNGVAYTYDDMAESGEYREFVTVHESGADGPNTYEWSEGSPP